jgi:hypothetical protein
VGDHFLITISVCYSDSWRKVESGLCMRDERAPEPIPPPASDNRSNRSFAPVIGLSLLPGSERTGLGGGRHREPELHPFGNRGQRFASHQFDRWPVLIEEAPCIVEIVRPHSNAASLSAGAVRYLKVKIEADCFQIFSDWLIISTHLVSPHFARVHSKFAILIFTWRDYGALGALKRRSPPAAGKSRYWLEPSNR